MFSAKLRGADLDRLSLSDPPEGFVVEGDVSAIPDDEQLLIGVFERYVASGGLVVVPSELEPGVWYWSDPAMPDSPVVPVTEEEIIAARSSCSDPAILAIAFLALAGAVFAFFGWLIWKTAYGPPARHEP
ncbi:MAG: hypothetical protein AAGA37_16780 [Actinomycetota bacterium]